MTDTLEQPAPAAPTGPGGPGRDTRGSDRAVPFALVVLLIATLLVAWWTKARCLDDGGWEGGEEYLGLCYTDIYPLWFGERLSEGAVPYFDHPVEYPVLTGGFMQVTAVAVRLLAPDSAPTAFFHLTSLLSAAMLLAVLGILWREGAGRRLLWYAGAPTLVAYAFLNWDPLALLFFVGAIAAHRRGKDGLSGALAGLGAATKLFPGLVVPFVIAARLAQGRRRDALVHGGAAAAAWLVVNLPIALAAPDSWLRFLRLNRERPANWDSLWYLAQRVRGADFDLSTINQVSAAAFLLGAVVIAVVGARRRDPSRWWELCLPVLCWFLLTNKVYSPQYSLWVLVLFPLVLRSPGPVAAFAVADLMTWVTEFPFLGGVGGLQPAPGYDVFAIALCVRYAVLAWILVAAVRDGPGRVTAALK